MYNDLFTAKIVSSQQQDSAILYATRRTDGPFIGFWRSIGAMVCGSSVPIHAATLWRFWRQKSKAESQRSRSDSHTIGSSTNQQNLQLATSISQTAAGGSTWPPRHGSGCDPVVAVQAGTSFHRRRGQKRHNYHPFIREINLLTNYLLNM